MPLEQDVLDMGHNLEKLVGDGKADSETTSDLLKRLKDLPITLDILQKTRIGMTVNVVRKASAREDVQTVAKGLIKSWKKLLDTQDKDKGKINRQSSQEKQKEKEKEKQNESTKNNTIKTTSLSRSDSTSSYEVPPVKDNDPVRIRCREMIANSLNCEDRPSFNPAYIAAEIEEATYNMFNNSSSAKYKNRIKSRVMNLRDKRNVDLKRLIIEGEVAPERFANMTSEEMACDELKQQRKQITEQAIKDHQLAKSGGTSTGQFKCGRCGKRNTTYNQVQTRSADEPMTTFVFCQECGNRWKFC